MKENRTGGRNVSREEVFKSMVRERLTQKEVREQVFWIFEGTDSRQKEQQGK